MQIELFPTGESPASRVNEERDRILTRVADTAGTAFTEAARGFILNHLSAHGPTAGEVLTRACKAAGIVPTDDRAFGPVYMSVARTGQIRKAGTVRRERGHGTSGGNVWALRAESA